MTDNMTTLLLTYDEVAEHLRCTRRQVEHLVVQGALNAVHIGRSVRVTRRELEAFIGRLQDGAA